MEDEKQEIQRRPCGGACHANEILHSLNKDRQSGLFTDVILRVDGQSFFCHKVILSSASSYFRAMFTSGLKESSDHVVELHDICPSVMSLVLDFMYRGRISIQEDNVEDILQASDRLRLHSLRDECVKFLDCHLDPYNCVGIMKFADMFSITSLSEKSKRMMVEGFEEVSRHEEFLKLSKEELVEYLSNDDLAVSKEEVVYEAVMRWVKDGEGQGRAALKELLEHVRLPLLDVTYFLEKVEKDKTIQECSECFPLLHETRIYHILGDTTNSRSVRPRRFMDVSEIIIVIGGCDKKGNLKLPYIDRYDPRTGQWTALSMFPGFTQSETALCTLKNNIYVSGGHINSRHVWMLNIQINSWVKMASLNAKRWRHGMVTLKGQIYAVGGFDGAKRLSSVERYDSFTNVWSPVTPMLEAVSSAAVVSCLNKLYVIGGAVEDFGNTDKVQCYHPEEEEWTYVSPAPFSKGGISGVEIDGTIYVVGGLTSTIFSYRPSTDRWSEEVVLPEPLESCGAAVYGGKLYIMGGRGENGEATDRCLVFDPETKQVSEDRPLLRSTSHHGCVTVLQKLRM
ncbi:kelch-like protein 35 isoform X1 [Bufo bufo]|uniref:kelch-like protein 35 isoform X1 n=1 Tax=Bufo bufo TaxID=8384 RepID=UPI001ABDFED1|nr:kelch-like protein 35 isoform X1 [Bufo bufo]XP_040282396.1 kelch-like protein 35 isoform X1 [Bufo bufo]